MSKKREVIEVRIFMNPKTNGFADLLRDAILNLADQKISLEEIEISQYRIIETDDQVEIIKPSKMNYE
jgi:hypothetical protein